MSASDDNLSFCWSPKHLEDMAKTFASGGDSDSSVDVDLASEGILEKLSELKDRQKELLRQKELHKELLRQLHALKQECQKKPEFLAALRTAAEEALTNPASGWDQDRQVATDTLIGASFAWQQPPCIIKVEAGSLANSCFCIGEVLVQVDETDVSTMTRDDILKLLKGASNVQFRESTPLSLHSEPETSTLEVELPDSCEPLTLQAEKMLLLGSEAVQKDPNIKEQVVHAEPHSISDSPTASTSAEHQAPLKLRAGESASKPVHSEVELDCSPVQEVYAARGLRPSPSQDAWTMQGSFLCNGKCGNRVTTTHQAYSLAGQIIFCDLCRAKATSTREQIMCQTADCRRTISYSKFLCKVQGCEVPTLCQTCQVKAGLGSWLLLDLAERLESSDKFGQ